MITTLLEQEDWSALGCRYRRRLYTVERHIVRLTAWMPGSVTAAPSGGRVDLLTGAGFQIVGDAAGMDLEAIPLEERLDATLNALLERAGVILEAS